MSGTDQSSCYWGNNIGSDSLLWRFGGGCSREWWKTDDTTKSSRRKGAARWDKSEELQTLLGLIGLSPLSLQNQELRPPTLSGFHLLPGILTCLPT